MKPAQLAQVLEPVYDFCLVFFILCLLFWAGMGVSRSECTSIFVLIRNNHLVLGIMMQLQCAMTVSFSMTM